MLSTGELALAVAVFKCGFRQADKVAVMVAQASDSEGTLFTQAGEVAAAVAKAGEGVVIWLKWLCNTDCKRGCYCCTG